MSKLNKLIHNIDFKLNRLRVGDTINDNYVVIDENETEIILSSKKEDNSIIIVDRDTFEILSELDVDVDTVSTKVSLSVMIQTIIDPSISDFIDIFGRYEGSTISVNINSQRYLLSGIIEFIETEDSYILNSNSYIYKHMIPGYSQFPQEDSTDVILSYKENKNEYSLTIKKNSGTVIRVTEATSQEEWDYASGNVSNYLKYSSNILAKSWDWNSGVFKYQKLFDLDDFNF